MAEDVEILRGGASMLEVFAVEISWSYEDSFALLVKNSDGPRRLFLEAENRSCGCGSRWRLLARCWTIRSRASGRRESDLVVVDSFRLVTSG